MNHTEIFERLVKLLGRSENDPEVIEILTELGVKLPLKRPKSYLTYNLLENKSWGFNLGFEYATTYSHLFGNREFKEKELIFDVIQDITDKEKFKDTTFPFGIKFGMSKSQLLNILGNYHRKNEEMNILIWRKHNLTFSLEFDDNDMLIEIGTYRLLEADEMV